MSIRSWAEYVSRGVVLRRRLPAKFGHLPIYVTPEAGLRYWWAMSRVDPVLYSMAEEIVKPGAVVWDVGANVGLFSLCAAALSGQSGLVLAIEPDFWLAHLINRSSQRLEAGRYKCSPVEVLCTSISDSNRISKLAIAERARASNYLIEATGSSEAKGTRCVQPTVSLTLDFLLEYFPAPSVLKIDAETHEVGVLLGAERLLNEVRPTIWCEVSAQNSEELTKVLHAAKYKLYGAQVRPHQPIDRAWFHTLAVPTSSCSE
jgi:FkbM family methyltransferase